MRNRTPKRSYVIGDIHGCLSELKKIIQLLINNEHINWQDRLIFLGDYVDRGPDSFGVIEYLVQLKTRYECVFLVGNHEIMFLEFFNNPKSVRFDIWMKEGGEATLTSYFRQLNPTPKEKPASTVDIEELKSITRQDIPPLHRQFFDELKPYLLLKKTGKTYFFSHAQLSSGFANMDKIFDHLKADSFKCQYFWGKYRYAGIYKQPGMVFISGHTVQDEVKNYGDVILMDTGCVFGGCLSVYCLDNKRIYKVKKK